MAQQIVWGCVNANGTTHSGTGFTTVPNPPGVYDVVFSIPFNSTPAVVAIQNYKHWNDFTYNGGDTRDNTVLIASDRTKFKLETGENDGKKSDRNFSFIAVGEV
ncbi:MAG TPA: hypothetical protein VLX28_22720 [Thermoanaerobaculia bacterium]|nr:hypothetical protein [Thermoanaerobaculia bacterium]